MSYLEAVDRSSNDDANPRDDDSLRNILSVLMAVQEPLSLAQLRKFGFDDAGELLRCHMGFLFHVGDDFKVYAFHKSVFDFSPPRKTAQATATEVLRRRLCWWRRDIK